MQRAGLAANGPTEHSRGSTIHHTARRGQTAAQPPFSLETTYSGVVSEAAADPPRHSGTAPPSSAQAVADSACRHCVSPNPVKTGSCAPADRRLPTIGGYREQALQRHVAAPSRKPVRPPVHERAATRAGCDPRHLEFTDHEEWHARLRVQKRRHCLSSVAGGSGPSGVTPRRCATRDASQ